MEKSGDTKKNSLGPRTRMFALRVIRLYTSLPKTTEAQVLGKQVLRSGTSAGAHYSEAQFAKSNKDFINKIESALQELEETSYWFQLIIDAQIVKPEKVIPIIGETRELIAIFVTIVKKLKKQ